MKNSAKKDRLDEMSIALLTEAGIISSLIQGLQEDFGNLPKQPRFIQVTDITLQDGVVKLTYTYSLDGDEISACLPIMTRAWLNNKRPLTSKQLDLLKSLARPVGD